MNKVEELTMLKARIIHALGGESIPFSLSDGDVLREEDSIKSLGERSALNFPLIPLSRPLVFIINSLSVASRSKSSFAGDDAVDDEWLCLLSLAWAFNSISCASERNRKRNLIYSRISYGFLWRCWYHVPFSTPTHRRLISNYKKNH